MPKDNSILRLLLCLGLSTQSRFFGPEAGLFHCCRLTYPGPMNFVSLKLEWESLDDHPLLEK